MVFTPCFVFHILLFVFVVVTVPKAVCVNLLSYYQKNPLPIIDMSLIIGEGK